MIKQLPTSSHGKSEYTSSANENNSGNKEIELHFLFSQPALALSVLPGAASGPGMC